MIKVKQIEPCPEKWGWKKPPHKDLSLYLEVDGYGYVCIVFHPQIDIAYYHAMPYENKMPKLRVILDFTNYIENRLRDLGVKLFVCSYDSLPKETTRKLITKHLKFKPINKYTYIKFL